MLTPLFCARQPLDSSDEVRWRDYVNWAKIPNLAEVVSLDTVLCPTVLPELSDEDWRHNVHEDFRLNYFYDLHYLIGRTSEIKRKNVLGLYRNPPRHIPEPPAPAAFDFIGYDLIEEATQISALTNCGGFPESFSNDELSAQGLISQYSRAIEVQQSLRRLNPSEHHAHCELYAIWRLS
ncbi:MAG TPA: hypothetical protein VFW23_09125 [Tepidisphaeraceae bacterium]|nr:hypothetical protein [Tepidisphaeraceae bacterium]